MAENTPFSVRMEQEDKEKLLQMIQDSGRSNKEFMGTLLSAYELNRAKIEIPDIAKDIEGLQALTQRINDYYVNIGKRIDDIQKSKDIEFTKEVEVYKSRIETLRKDNDKLSNELTSVQESYNNISSDYEDIKKQLQQIQESLKDKSLLVEEYKQKNDTMTGLLKKYEKYPEQLEATNMLLATQQADNIQLSSSIKDKDFAIENLNNEVATVKQDKENMIQELNNKHSEAIGSVKERAELQKDKAILELKTQHQHEEQEMQHKHNEEIQEYQSKYKELLQELEQIKKNSSTRIKATKKQDTKPL